MFAISRQEFLASPSSMRFHEFWIYDLKNFHDFWIKKLKSNPAFKIGHHPWELLKIAYSIHLFSPIETLKPLAFDFFNSSQIEKSHQPSAHDIENTFFSFENLGFKKIFQLERFDRASIQKRFGKAWGQLWEGLFQHSTAHWIWEPYQRPHPLIWLFEFEDLCNHHDHLKAHIQSGLETLEKNHPHFTIQSLELEFILSQPTETAYKIQIEFSYWPRLGHEKDWILKLLSEKLSHLQFPFPVWKLKLTLQASPHKQNRQLTLFHNSKEIATHKNWNPLALKLKDQGFNIFEPAPRPSHLPEESWAPEFPRAKKHTESFHDYHRPIFQYPPQQISKPEGRMILSERIEWFDKNGKRHKRDYFFSRFPRVWKWVFKNECHQWFEQGIVE